jgi:hypothetical protein
MKLQEGSITVLASEGRLTLQVPEWSIGDDSELVEYPDRWFVRLHGRRPCVGRESGYLFLSREGWKANREILKQAFSTVRGAEWSDFEQHAEKHFQEVQATADKLVAKLTRQLDEARRAAAKLGGAA